MNKPKGGRGKKAPYKTSHIRVPLALKPAVERAIAEFRELALNGEIDPEFPISQTGELQLKKSEQDNLLPSLEEATEIAEKLLKQKQSARKTVEKLLSKLYGNS